MPSHLHRQRPIPLTAAVASASSRKSRPSLEARAQKRPGRKQVLSALRSSLPAAPWPTVCSISRSARQNGRTGPCRLLSQSEKRQANREANLQILEMGSQQIRVGDRRFEKAAKA